MYVRILHNISMADFCMHYHTDYFELALRGNPDVLSETGGLCPSRPDITTSFIRGPAGFGPSTTLNNIDAVQFNTPFCLAFAAETNPANTGPLITIVTSSAADPDVQLVIDSRGVTLTLANISVTFVGSQFASGAPQRLQICVDDGGSAALYSNCVIIDIAQFNPVPTVDDVSNGVAFLFREILGGAPLTTPIYDVSVQSFCAVDNC